VLIIPHALISRAHLSVLIFHVLNLPAPPNLLQPNTFV
jgi:hypothetical protein